jgi:hypothetical protein
MRNELSTTRSRSTVAALLALCSGEDEPAGATGAWIEPLEPANVGSQHAG